jgi:hypothetical protein
MDVTVHGAPGYEDEFPARLMAELPSVDGTEMISVLVSANEDWHALPSRYVIKGW